MDRNLRVQEGDILFAELNFIYETQVAGFVSVTIYGSVTSGAGFSSPFPLVIYTTEFSHPVLTTFTAVEEFDRAFLKAQPVPPQPKNEPEIIVIDYNDKMEVSYEAVYYRYLLTAPFAGIADIYSNFIKNTKELNFTSGTQIGADESASSNGFETNLSFCARFANENLIIVPTEFPLVGWRLNN